MESLIESCHEKFMIMIEDYFQDKNLISKKIKDCKKITQTRKILDKKLIDLETARLTKAKLVTSQIVN